MAFRKEALPGTKRFGDFGDLTEFPERSAYPGPFRLAQPSEVLPKMKRFLAEAHRLIPSVFG